MVGSRRRPAINSSALHVFDVLRFVAAAPEALGVTEISRRLNLPASTVHRALSSLEETDFIQRYQNTPSFELGMMPHLLNRAFLNHFALHDASRPMLHVLASETGLTVSLWHRLGWYAVRIGGAFGSQDVHHRARFGDTEQLHEGPGPSAILAYLQPQEREAYARFAAARFTDPPLAPGGWPELERELTQVRERGYASQALPIGRDHHAVALPVRDAQERVVASLSVEGAHEQARPTKALLEAREAVEARLRADPERFVSPFAHMAPDDIFIRIPRQGDAD